MHLTPETACPPLPTQNLALNIAEKGFPISVYNRSYEKTELAVKRAQKEGRGRRGFCPCLLGFDGVIVTCSADCAL